MLSQTKCVIRDDAIGTVICHQCNKIMDRGVYTSKNECRYCGCTEEPIIIDELIAPVIVLLNKKGYITRTCCSGHIHTGHGYIEFYTHDLLESINKFANGKYNFYKFNYYDEFVIRWEFLDYKNGVIRSMNDLININKLLYRWAKSLPHLSKDVK
jgi:hypothetical protein